MNLAAVPPKPKAPASPTGPVRIQLTGTNLCLGNKGDALSHLVACTSNEADGFELKTSEAKTVTITNLVTKLTFQNKCLNGWHSTLHFVDCDIENIITLKSTTPAKFGLTIESTGGPMCMTVAGKDFYAGLSVEALACHTDAANPQNNDWLILKS